MSEYEYPTDEELETIKNWDHNLGYKAMIEYVRKLWWMPDWGFKVYSGWDNLFKRRVTKWQLHTGGWSGNENIIQALRENWLFWITCFQKETRGGHFWFWIKRESFIGADDSVFLIQGGISDE